MTLSRLSHFQLIAPAALAIAACLSGCIAYQPRQIDARRSLASFEARRLDAPGLRGYMERALHHPMSAWPLQSWSFPQLTLAADYYNDDLTVARAKLAAAEAAVITAGARPNPTLALSPSYDMNAESGISPWTLGFTLDIPVETAGKRGYRKATAQQLANAARLQVAGVAWRVRSQLRDGLVQLHAAERRLRFLSQQVAAANQETRLLAHRVSVGETSATELELARIAADEAAMQLQEARDQAGQTRLAVAAALGVPERALDGIHLGLAGLDAFPAPGRMAPSREQALRDRTDVLASLADYAASDSALRLEIAKQYPDLDLGPGLSHGYTVRDLDNSLTLGVSLTLPLFNRNRGPIAEAEARRREAAARFNAIQARAVTQVDAALGGYEAALTKLSTANRLLAEQHRRTASIQTRFDTGETDRLTLVRTRSELATDELARLQSFEEAQLALGALENAMQRPVLTDER